MPILHPIFIIILGIMLFIFFSEEEISYPNLKRAFLLLIIAMIVMAGGRYFVGADYPVYKSMYEEGFPLYTTYVDVWRKATFQDNAMEIEWAYVLINKVFFDLGLPYYVLTFFLATLSLSIYYNVLIKYSPFASFGFLFYLLPLYFITECGQMRQGLGAAFVLLSIRYIINRQFWKFLLIIYLALGFHKSAIIFLPAYWIILLPFNAKRWFIFLVASVLLAPFEIYNFFGSVVESLMPKDVSNAYTGYSNDTYYGNDMKTGFADVINWFFIVILLIFDKVGERKVYYYEYFRNLAFFGYCLFYIFRGNEIFATRLPGVYFAMAGYFLIPGILKVVNDNTRRTLRMVFLLYFLGFFVLFSMGNAKKGSFTWDRYKNILWSKTK